MAVLLRSLALIIALLFTVLPAPVDGAAIPTDPPKMPSYEPDKPPVPPGMPQDTGQNKKSFGEPEEYPKPKGGIPLDGAAAKVGVPHVDGQPQPPGRFRRLSSPGTEQRLQGMPAGGARARRLQGRLRAREVTPPGEAQGFNPQPEPPGRAGRVYQKVKPAETQGLNPQPEPPMPADASRRLTPGEAQGFNPQPEPPGREGRLQRRLRPQELRGLNPQPEPPMPADRQVPSPTETRGLNPQPEPPIPADTGTISPVEQRGLNPQPEPP